MFTSEIHPYEYKHKIKDKYYIRSTINQKEQLNLHPKGCSYER